jgi:hypothetical protein
MHPSLESSARWHGRRIGEARRRTDSATAAYEAQWWRYMRSHYSSIEQADADAIFYRAERAALVGEERSQ